MFRVSQGENNTETIESSRLQNFILDMAWIVGERRALWSCNESLRLFQTAERRLAE